MQWLTTNLYGQVATVLTACGIETLPSDARDIGYDPRRLVATVLTACGIETSTSDKTESIL